MSDDVEARHELVDTVLYRECYQGTEARPTNTTAVLLALMEDHAAILSLEQRPHRQVPSLAIAV